MSLMRESLPEIRAMASPRRRRPCRGQQRHVVPHLLRRHGSLKPAPGLCRVRSADMRRSYGKSEPLDDSVAQVPLRTSSNPVVDAAVASLARTPVSQNANRSGPTLSGPAMPGCSLNCIRQP